MIKVVSSMSLEGYKTYGKRFLESWIAYWPEDVELHCYIEGPKKDYRDLPANKNVVYHNLFKQQGVVRLLDAMSVFPVMQGVLGRDGKRNYRYDIFTFARKIMAQAHAALDHDDLLFWVDADTEFFADITEDWLRGLFTETIYGNPYMVYMDRPAWGHSCASFVGWDCSNTEWNGYFWINYFSLLTHGRFLLLPEWHDSYLLDTVRKQMGIPGVDLAAGLTQGDGPENVFDLVFKNKARHLKGNLKRKNGPQRYAQLIDLVRQVQPKRIIEIGTWNGERAVEMSRAAPGVEYIGFDLFELATNETDVAEKNVKPHHSAKDVTDFLTANGVNVGMLVAGNTRETFPQFLEDHPDKKADLVYIDGGHSVETVRSDFLNAISALKDSDDGLIVLDDYYENMPEEDLEKWGCNKVLEEACVTYQVLPIGDPVKGGGITKMAVVHL